MDCKYTNDGRKVIVVGKLNSEETIVQEIYVKNGNEFPSGENFVVKSLHDEQCESWKSYETKRKEKLEKELEIENKSFDSNIKMLNKEHRKISSVVSNKLKFLKGLNKALENENFDRFCDFVTGKIKYLVILYYKPEIVGFNSKLNVDSDYDQGDLKLITLFGRSNGDLTFNINRYSDGSGSNDIIHPFKTYEDALAFLSERLNSKDKYSSYDIEAADKYNIVLDKEKLLKYYEATKQSINKEIKDSQDCINRKKIVLGEIESKINKV